MMALGGTSSMSVLHRERAMLVPVASRHRHRHKVDSSTRTHHVQHHPHHHNAFHNPQGIISYTLLSIVLLSSLPLVCSLARHPPSQSSAEYFYASDKLADREVQLYHSNHSSRSSRPSSPSSSVVLSASPRVSWVPPPPNHLRDTPQVPAKPTTATLTTTTTTTTTTQSLLDFWPQPIYPGPSSSPPTLLESSLIINSTDNLTNSSSSHQEKKREEVEMGTPPLWFALKDEQWVAPIIALCALNLMVILGFECFVIYRACRTCPSRRHFFLGQMLLLGLFLSSLMGLAFVPNANWLSCTIIRAGLGVCYALVYATLLVKSVFLLSLHTGVYLSWEYQALLLFFVLSTQVAIDAQWLLHQRSSTVIDYMDGYGHAVYKCDHSIHQLLLSLVYVIVLIVIISILAFRVRGYRENHGEALFLGISTICTVVLWLVWIAGSLTSTPHYRDGFVAFGVVGNATLIFIVMFLPKGRQLAAVGRSEGLNTLERDQLSTASSPSIYTPSFLHIKPVSQLIPLNKPIAGFGGGSTNSGSAAGGYHHIYKQFQGSGTAVTSPNMPNSFSSHAIFSFTTKDNEEDGNDPNYSNLSNVFTTSTTVPIGSSGESKTALGIGSNLNSPMSENVSSASSSAHSKSSSSKQTNSHGSSKHSSRSSGHKSESRGFFYLQPPPLPPPPAPVTCSGPSVGRSHWRQSCYTSNFGLSGRSSHHHGEAYYPKSLALGSYHPSLPPVPSVPGSTVGTPLGLPPHLLSPANEEAAAAAFYFTSFEQNRSTQNQNQTSNNNSSSSSAAGHNSNFKYFRGSHY